MPISNPQAPTSDWLKERAYTTPGALALLIDERHWTYGELDRLVDGYARHLLALGLAPGDKLATLLPAELPAVCLVHAAARLGLLLAPLNTRLALPELARQLAHLGNPPLVYDEATASVAALLAGDGQWTVPVSIFARRPPSADPFAIPPFRLDAVQAIVFTSGTTGEPKGVMLTFANHFWSATASAYRLGVQPDDRWLSCLPLYHVGGLAVLFRSCLYGTAVVLHARFAVDAFNHSLDTQAITLTSLVPTMLYRLLPTRGQWPASLRLVLLGGAAAPPALLADAAAAGVAVATTYGLTEAASQVATLLPAGVRRKPGSVGRPLLFTRVRIVDDQGRDQPAGTYGEVVVSGPTVMAGYYENEVATARALRSGELYTGDVGYLDADGDLWLVQRRSDIIVSGGENVYPAEVEEVLRRHPAVRAACVVGVPHPEWGQQVAALVAVRPGVPITSGELLAFCREHLAGYKLPRRLRLTGELPQTASGKIARQQVQQQLTDEA